MADEPQFDNWKDAWEYRAKEVFDYSMTLSEDELLSYIKENRRDLFMQIWRAIGEKGTIGKSAMVLYDYLKDHPGKDHYL
ncbi:MAG: hypothetical protein Q8O89_01690, partial [Nanoarchaeota archaeon]|nr:hypothetical protein [Nanoarchaeota archaeon]